MDLLVAEELTVDAHSFSFDPFDYRFDNYTIVCNLRQSGTTDDDTNIYLEVNDSAPDGTGMIEGNGFSSNEGFVRWATSTATSMTGHFTQTNINIYNAQRSNKKFVMGSARGTNDASNPAETFEQSWFSSYWNDSNPITKFTITANGASNFVAGSVFRLYGWND